METKTKKGTKGNKLFNAREGNNLIRSGKSLEEGCCGTSLSTKRPIFEQYIYSEKEGWGQQTCDQLEGIKPIYSFPTLQNGEFTVVENSLAKKNEYMCKLDLKNVYLCVPLSQDDQKRVMFRWEETSYQFLCLCFGVAPAPCFHKTPKGPHGPFQEDRETHSNLFGQHVDYWQNEGRDYSSTRYSHSFTSVHRICYKSEKVNDDSSSGDRIYGNDSQFKGNDCFPSTEKTTINKTCVSGFASESRDNSFRVNKGVRPPDIDSFGHSPSKTPLSFSPTTTNSGTEEKWLLRSQVLLNKEPRLELLYGMKTSKYTIEGPLFNFQLKLFYRCFVHRLGGSLGRNENWRDMHSAGEKDTHKRTGTSCIKTGPGDLFESTGDKVTAYSDGKYSGPDLLSAFTKKIQMVGLSFQTSLETAITEKVTVTAEYLPSALKKHTDIESRPQIDSSEWKLAPSVFQRLCVKMEKPLIDLFASRVSHQLLTYAAWRIQTV